MSVASQVTDVLCNGTYSGSINLSVSGGTPPYTYLWSNGATTEDIGLLTAGNYSVLISDNNLCDTTMSFTVNEPPAYQITQQSTPVTCHGMSNGSVVLGVSGASPPYTIIWSNGDTGLMADSLGAGLQTVTITDIYNCDSVIEFLITDPPLLILQSQITPVSCYGSADGKIELVVVGGIPPYTFDWSNGSTSNTIENLVPGEYDVIVTDSLLCTKSDTFIINSPLQVEISSVIKPVSCKGFADGAISLTVNGGTPPYAFLWSDGSAGSSIAGKPGGDYSVTIVDSKLCDTVFSFVLPEADSIVIQATIRQPTCHDSKDGSIQTAASGGMPPYSYMWSNGESLPSVSGLSGGTYQLDFMDTYGCSVVQSYILNNPAVIQVTPEIFPASCSNNGEVNVTVTGGIEPYSFMWSNGATAQNISELPTGTYVLQITDAADCIMNFDFVVEGAETITINPIITPCRCYGSKDGQILLEISGGNGNKTTEWNVEELHGNHIVYLATGTYICTVTDELLCQASDTLFVPQPDSLFAGKTVNPVICEGRRNGSIFLQPSGGTPPYTYIWSNGSREQNLENVGKGFYSFGINDVYNCAFDDTVTLHEISCNIFIPNVYTPNADGVNDNFEIVGIEYFPDNELLIFNRWGKELLQFKGYKNEWDGRDASGDRVADGVYYYLLNLSDGRHFQGSVTIMR